MNKRSTTARMTRHIKALGVTPSQVGAWCGLSLKDWLDENPKWSERQWYDLLVENLTAVRNGLPEPQFVRPVPAERPAKRGKHSEEATV